MKVLMFQCGCKAQGSEREVEQSEGEVGGTQETVGIVSGPAGVQTRRG